MDYLLLLNHFGGRSVADFSQFPVFPWVTSPSLEPRNLALPMGQLNKDRATHFDAIFEGTDPHYFYGFHYSLPGAVFYLMTRLPPFTFFLWDMNCGWDNPQRMFTSLADCWRSASQKNTTDLRELIPHVFQVPEMFVNLSGLSLPRSDVVLPDWAMSSPFLFVSIMRNYLEQAETLNVWVDLIFGVKQTGDKAVQAKNVFLPTSYHSSTPESVGLDPNAFAAQVANYGQCPTQLFQQPHLARAVVQQLEPRSIETQITVQPCDIKNPTQLRPFSICRGGTAIPSGSCPLCEHYAAIEDGVVAVRRQGDHELLFRRHFGRAVTIGGDCMFVAVGFLNGKVAVFQVIYENKVPHDLLVVSRFSLFDCPLGATVISQDFLVAVALADTIVVLSFATGLLHRDIAIGEVTITHFYDEYEGILTVVLRNRVVQFSINGDKLHELVFKENLTCGCGVGYGPVFNARFVIVGDATGTLLFCIVLESFELKVIFDKKVLSRGCGSLYFDRESGMLWCADDRGAAVQVDFGIAGRRVVKCKFCMRPKAGSCAACQCPVC
jgi:hypothetical protein